MKCKKHLILPKDQSKSPKNDKNVELELYWYEGLLTISFTILVGTYENILHLKSGMKDSTYSLTGIEIAWWPRKIIVYLKFEVETEGESIILLLKLFDTLMVEGIK